MAEVNMPKLSDTMEEGTVVEWKKKSGETVKKGDVIAEVESDKAAFDLESEADGELDIMVQQGVPGKIGAPIARIGAAGEAPAAKPAPKEEAPKPAAKAEKPKAAPEAPPPPAPAPAPQPQAAPATQDGDGAAITDDVRASPLARRLAAELGVNLATIKATGPEAPSATEG